MLKFAPPGHGVAPSGAAAPGEAGAVDLVGARSDPRAVVTERTGARAPPLRSGPPASPSGRLRRATGRRVAALAHRARLGAPDLGGVLGDGAVARERPGAGDVLDRPARPFLGIRVGLEQPPVG